MPHCKICDYERDSVSSVRAHIQGSTSGDHEGISYSQADPFIGDDTDDEASSKNDENAPPSENEENPLMSEPEVSDDSSEGAESDRTRTEQVTCYECDRDVGTREEVESAMEQGNTSHAWCEHCGAPIEV